MSTSEPDTSTAFFEALYRKADDPWNFAESSYEQSRYAAMDARLGTRRFTCAFEPACSVGVFTRQLGQRCDQVIASDAAPTAVAKARIRCETMPHVHIERAELPIQLPARQFDLIVFAECGYYFPVAQLRSLIARLCDRLTLDGVLLACHSLQEWPDHPLHGALVHELINEEPRLLIEPSSQPDDKRFRLDYWRKGQ